jgi:RimJ/RimL family protein N-acetyltransferase
VISLRSIRDDDIKSLVSACQDPDIPRWTRVPSPYTEAEARAFIGIAGREREHGTGVHLLAVDASSDELLGAVSLHEINSENLRADIGYWVARGARRRGIATRAVRLIAGHGFESLLLERISIHVDPENEPSKRVAEAAGFEREAKLRRWIRVNERQRDAIIYAMLRPA